jgi:transcriptional regulator with XRE-family HTH domain
MAKVLGVTPSFLSAVETGKKSIPANFFDKFVSLYKLSEDQKLSLEKAIQDSRLEEASKKTSIRMTIATANPRVNELAYMFSRNANSLSEEQKKKLFEILDNPEG